MTWEIPLFATEFGPEEEAAVLRPLRRGWVTMGEEVEALEADLRERSGARHALAVANGTAALQLAAHALDVAGGDVICPALTFVASASAARMAGATLRLADIEATHLPLLSAASVATLMTPDTRAVVAVHYAGFAADMAALREAAGDVPIIEDCAHALFTRHDGRMLGTHGRIGCFSFFSNKNATCGEGGALVTDDDDLADRMRLLRSHGMTTGTAERHRGRVFGYDVVEPGFNYRMDEIRAALLRVQLGRLDGYLERRRTLYAGYVERFAGSRVEVLFRDRAEVFSDTAIHICSVLLPAGVDRPRVMAALRDEGIQTSHHYPAIHTLAAYRDATADAPLSEVLAARQLTLPLFPRMRDEDVDRVAEVLLGALEA